MAKKKDPQKQINTPLSPISPDERTFPSEAMTPETQNHKHTALLNSHKDSFLIIGIGASAGGLAAIEALFTGIAANDTLTMAYVLVQHLSPDHKSILHELVKRYTNLDVFEVENGMIVQPKSVYIIPPNHNMALINKSLQLFEQSGPRGQRLPIDFFFRSVAHDQKHRAIGIILSGTGSDGTLGARAIKGEGGLVIAQHPDSCEYEGMPRSVIASGSVDYILTPAEMANQLKKYSTHVFGTRTQILTPHSINFEDAIKKICILIRSQTGHDFSLYKQNTIMRRIERRMAVQQIKYVEEYIKYLHYTPVEIEALFFDLLIGVTNFFRDTEAFEALEKQVIPLLFQGIPLGTAFRIWVPGCSTGEEAYSIAILIQEHIEQLKQNYKVQIFATDIDNRAITNARMGVYPENITSDVTPKRLTRFFIKEAEGYSYRIHKNIRDMVIFSKQDIIKDPPFSKIDLICCRNLLIYSSCSGR